MEVIKHPYANVQWRLYCRLHYFCCYRIK